MFQNTIGICRETKIIMQNGHTKNVEDLIVGDKILACDGTINELIELPIIQQVPETKLYGIEGVSIESKEKITIEPFFLLVNSFTLDKSMPSFGKRKVNI